MDSTDSERSCPASNTDNVTSVKALLGDASEDKVYEYFSLTAKNMQDILDSFDVLKAKLGLSKKTGLDLFKGLRLTLGSQGSKVWKARDMLNLLEKRANQKEYMQQKAATGVRVFIVGAGPVGLRLAIDCVLLGAEVVVVEKRKSFSRNNILHLWPFTIEDLRQLGAKKFYGKFCAGAIDHISIRALQCILLKVALLLGVRFIPGIEFLEIQEPETNLGWHAKLNPSDHPLNLFEFDVLVGADGARKSCIPGFDRKELRGKLALAITANFKRYYSREEAEVQEISGVAFIFNQKFFKDLKEDTDIDLENIVYYKDDTHYFVMTAKKDSLFRKGVLMTDYHDTGQLLHPNNIHMDNLHEYASQAAGWCTELSKLDFELNSRDKKDVSLFDFTSIHQAEYAAQAINRGGRDLYLCLVGDALLEPFWPIGTGCARGFLGAMDTAWLVKRIGQKKSVLEVLCERESVFQRLPQTTPESLVTNIKSYTINPKSRYPNLHLHLLKPANVAHLYDTDDTMPSPALRHGSIKVVKSPEKKSRVVADSEQEKVSNMEEESVPVEKKRKVEPEPPSLTVSLSPRRKSLKSRGSTHLAYYAEPEEVRSLKDPAVLLDWLKQQVKKYGIKVTDLTSSWSDGMALCALIHHYQPDLIPDFKQLSAKNFISNNELAFSLAEEHFGISRLLKPKEMKKPDKLTLLSYLSLFYELFLDMEPAPPPSDVTGDSPNRPTDLQLVSAPVDKGKEGVAEGSPVKESGSGKKKKRNKGSLFRRSSRKKILGASPSSAERSWNTSSVKRDASLPSSPPVTKLTSGTPLTTIQEKPSAASATTPVLSRTSAPTTLGFKPPSTDSSDFCYFCSKRVYLMERMSANGFFFHRTCFRCSHCNCQLKFGAYSLSKGVGGEKGKFFCSVHYRQLFLSNPEKINYSWAGAGAGGKAGGGGEEEEVVGVANGKEVEAKVEGVEESGRKEESRKGRSRKSKTPLSTDEEVSSGESCEQSPKKRKASLRERFFSRSKSSSSVSRSRSSSAEPEEVRSSPVDEHRPVIQGSPRSTGSRTPSSVPGSPARSSVVQESKVELRQKRPQQSGLVQRLSLGFEHLEAAARDTEIQLGTEGRERAKSMLSRNVSGPIQQPFEANSLSVILEANGTEGVPKRSRSPARWRGSLQQSRTHIEEVPNVHRSSRSITRRPNRENRGQRSVSRPLFDNYTTSDVAIQERRKQQRRFRDAQQIQREMSQLERQYDELEQVGKEYEMALRDAEETKQEEALMKAWLGLVNERNGLVRKTSELSLRMKELELEDRQYEIDKKLGALNRPADQLTDKEIAQFEELCEQKIKIVEERDELVNQTEEERLREREEDLATEDMRKDGFVLYDHSSDDSDDEITANGTSEHRRGTAPARPSHSTQDVPTTNGKSDVNKRKSWWSFGKN